MNIFKEATELQEKNIPFAITTITEAKGSTPRTTAKMIVLQNGNIIGTIGGGLVEQYIIDQARSAIQKGFSRTITSSLLPKGKNAVGMECGGVVTVFIEVVNARPKLLLIGGGHVNLAVSKAAVLLDFDIQIVENRKDFVTEERFPMARKYYYDKDLAKAINLADIKKDTYIIIATNHDDTTSIREVINSPAAYIGMLGSKRKVSTVVNELISEGFSEEKISAVYSPVGLDIGAETPEEIAFSVLAEVLMVKNRKKGHSLKSFVDDLVVIRGGGDLATGTAWRLFQCGFKVVILEIGVPTVVRRSVSFAQAMFEGSTVVQGVKAVKAEDLSTIYDILEDGIIPVFEDSEGESINILKPAIVIDAILAKQNYGTKKNMAQIVIGLGPGYTAGDDVDAVIETKRGHTLGKVIFNGKPLENTGIPGKIHGISHERVIYAPLDGTFKSSVSIGSVVKKGDIMALIDAENIKAPISGIVRGLIYNGISVKKQMKIGDIDPRGHVVNCDTISDKALAVAGGVLEAIFYLRNQSTKKRRKL